MNETPKVPAPRPDQPEESLEDLVYRSSLCEGNQAVRGAKPWLTLPVTLVLCGVLGGLVVLAAGRQEVHKTVQSVGIVLQEGSEPPAPPGPAGGPGPAPASHVRLAAPAAPAVAPAPASPPKEPPAQARDLRETVPDAVPRDLPREDHAKDYGSAAAAAGTGAGAGSGTGVGAGGAGSGHGVGGGAGGGGTGPGGAPGRIRRVDITQLGVKERAPKPPYPPLARSARIEGTVMVEITVGADGVPISARALSGPYQLRATAVAHFLAWRFAPYLENGVPLVAQVTYSIKFKLD